jgi:hypothetical protein
MHQKSMTSRQRMEAALSCQPPDHVPCSFMLYNALKSRSRDYFDFIEKQVSMGLDATVQIPIRPPLVANDYYNLHGLPVSHHPAVKIKEWVSHPDGEEHPILVKEYFTPAGQLSAEVRKTPDWRWGDHVPFLDDFITPRSRKFLLCEPADLKAFEFLLADLSPVEIEAFQREAKAAKAYADEKQLLVAGGWGVGADLIGWVHGLENMMFSSYDRPDFLAAMLEVIARWNRRRMEVVLEAGVQLYIKRAWYENCDFWSPKTWKKFIYPILKADVECAHHHGAKFGYLITSNCMPLLDLFDEIGVDCLIGVDPARWDLQQTKEKLDGKVCLWGGINGYNTVEMGNPEQVRAEAREAMRLFNPAGGYILSPVDNVREDTALSRRNVAVLIEEWQKLRDCPQA